MALELDGEVEGRSRGKRRRVDERGGGPKDVAAAAAIQISDAIRTATLAQGWHDLWRSRWAHPTSCRDVHVLPGDHPKEALRLLDGGPPRHRLDRFTLVVDNHKFWPPHLRRLLTYAAECRAGDLRVDLRHCWSGAAKLNYHFARSSPVLTHLSLRRVNIPDIYFRGAQPLRCLEVIRLNFVAIGVAVDFSKTTALCPRLHTLDVRRCHRGDIFYGDEAFVPPAGASLRSVTVADCLGDIRLDIETVPSLRSFRYSGGLLSSPFFLLDDVALHDLYMHFTDRNDYGTYYYCDRFDRALPGDLSGFAGLTICSKALKIAPYLLNDRPTTQWAKLYNLQGLRELQLLMFGMQNENLADIYVFLNASHCPCVERLFVRRAGGVEPPENGLDNLRTVKVMNFNWRRFEVQLVSFLLRKASSLHKLLLVSPSITLQHVPGVPEADFLVIEEALASCHIILSESDDAATEPFHSEVFSKV
ncbi:hypothetical protein ACP70R_019068 [Stipagrostis hirtigluma subsp. patula]